MIRHVTLSVLLVMLLSGRLWSQSLEIYTSADAVDAMRADLCCLPISVVLKNSDNQRLGGGLITWSVESTPSNVADLSFSTTTTDNNGRSVNFLSGRGLIGIVTIRAVYTNSGGVIATAQTQVSLLQSFPGCTGGMVTLFEDVHKLSYSCSIGYMIGQTVFDFQALAATDSWNAARCPDDGLPHWKFLLFGFEGITLDVIFADVCIQAGFFGFTDRQITGNTVQLAHNDSTLDSIMASEWQPVYLCGVTNHKPRDLLVPCIKYPGVCN